MTDNYNSLFRRKPPPAPVRSFEVRITDDQSKACWAATIAFQYEGAVSREMFRQKFEAILEKIFGQKTPAQEEIR